MQKSAGTELLVYTLLHMFRVIMKVGVDFWKLFVN